MEKPELLNETLKRIEMEEEKYLNELTTCWRGPGTVYKLNKALYELR